MAKSIDKILSEIRSVLEEQQSDLATFPDYGNLYAIFRSIASVISEQDSDLDDIYDSLFLNTTSDESLNKRALEYGLTRSEGSRATGFIVMEAPNSLSAIKTTVINPGLILLNPFTNKQYVTLEQAFIDRRQVSVKVESLEASSSVNLESGTRLISNFYKNIDFTVGSFYNSLTREYEGDITGGSDKETDAELRSRILEIVQIKQSSTREAIRITAQKVQGVQEVLIEENIPSAGYINVYIDNTSFDAINQVKLNVDSVKPLGTIVTVRSFDNFTLNISLNIALFNNDNLNDKSTSIRSIVTKFISNLGKTFTKESLAGVLLNSSIINNVEVLSPVGNISIGNKEKFTIGSIDIKFI